MSNDLNMRFTQDTAWINTTQYPLAQMPAYPDMVALGEVCNTLATYPPLVFVDEVERLKQRLAQAARGECFVIQGGDCAESFADFNTRNIKNTYCILLQMAMVFHASSHQPCVLIGRMAGQYAKPRSQPYETQGTTSLPSYHGDIVNGHAFNSIARTPNPARMREAYFYATATLNFLRSFSSGGYMEIQKASRWLLDFMQTSDMGRAYQDVVTQVAMQLEHPVPAHMLTLSHGEFFVSHEALLLPYENALTRVDTLAGRRVDTSAHMLWLGARTCDPDGAHVAFLSEVINPIGIKCTATLTKATLIRLLERLNPTREAGKIVLILRFGAQAMQAGFTHLVEAVASAEQPVLWCIDPMHGNTISTATGHKTRHVEAIVSEVSAFFAHCTQYGIIPGGIHLEVVGKNVSECIGGLGEVSEVALLENYHSLCDPRLNDAQALALAFHLASLVR